MGTSTVNAYDAVTAQTGGTFSHGITGALTSLANSADDYTTDAITDFMNVVNKNGVTTGAIIEAAAKLKTQLGASKAYYDVIATLGDDQKRVIEGAVK